MKACSKEGCEPVLQTRKDMKSGDYFDVFENDRMEPIIRRIVGDYQPEDHESNNHHTDVRVICKRCHKTTGWGKADAPGMPGIGIEFLKKKWEEMT